MIFSTTIGPITYHLSTDDYAPNYLFLSGHVYTSLAFTNIVYSCSNISCDGLAGAINPGSPCLLKNLGKCHTSTMLTLFPDLPTTNPEFFL